MKKNGFTLIELLAVIVILAIIALIATPIILNIINDARESANERSKELYETAVKTAIMKKKIEDPKAEIKGSFTQTNAGRTLTSASGDVVLTVEYDGDVQCDVIEVLDNYELKLDGCKVEGVDSNYNGTVTTPSTPSNPGGSNNPSGGQEPEDNNTLLYPDAPAPVAFTTDSWETIINAVQTENTTRYNVGDTKTVDLGSLGVHTVRVANKSNTGDVCTKDTNESGEPYSKTACGFVIEFADIITEHIMREDGINRGGYPVSELHTYVNNNIYNALPSELKKGIIDTTVVSFAIFPNGMTKDKVYLLSVSEIYGQKVEYDAAKHLTRQLDYYEGVTTSSYSKAIKQYKENNYHWWVRTGYSPSAECFQIIIEDGSLTFNYSNNHSGVSPAFRIG